jgi:CheY-like chemotaxis protein/anti-sigma regulatory factor (Ser/Thr protein kinase)
VELRLNPCDAVAHTDPVLLGRMLRNLVDNAVKYTSHGHVLVDLRVEDGALRVAVQDSGEGIPPQERERIFEEFYQIGNAERDRTRGLGLGLAIVKRIGALLGTEISLASEPGRGSTFTIRLPLSRAAPQPAGAAPEPAPDPERLRGRGVLVIDDEPDIRVGMRRLLEAWGCRVFVCSGLADAMRMIDDHAPRIDLIMADFRLRAGESGIATVAELRRRLGPLPAMLLSGDTAPERIREAEASGLPMLHKPASAEALQRVLVAQLAA